MHLSSAAVTLGLAVAAVLAAPNRRVKSRDSNYPRVIDHDAIMFIPQSLPNTTMADVYQLWRPVLHVEEGCLPYPAVDEDGNISGGLKNTGDKNADCDSSYGQLYVRSRLMDDTHMLLIMWAWFFPKEETSQWIGHRYGWQSAVLALNPDDTTDGGIMGMALWNGDDGYDYLAPEKINYIQDHMILKYKAVKPNRYRIQSTNWIDKETRFDMPMVEWEMMPSQARQALQVFDFRTGKNKPECPVKDGIFDDRIKTAGEEIVKGTHGDGSSPNSGDVK